MSLRDVDLTLTRMARGPYEVKVGDRLSEIALNHDASVQELLDINPQILDPDVIYIGDLIEVPAGHVDANKALPSDRHIELPSVLDALIEDPGATSGILIGSLRTWQEVRLAYEASQSENGLPSDYHTDGAWPWQCTAWAYVRWRELGRQGAIYSPSGRSWATANGGRPTNMPTLGAAASYQNGGHGHVMIVEQISADFTQFRVSEMNVGDDLVRGVPTEYRSDQWFMSGPRQTWISRKTGATRSIIFAPIDGGRGSTKLR